MFVLATVQLVADYVCKTYQKMTILSYAYTIINGGIIPLVHTCLGRKNI